MLVAAGRLLGTLGLRLGTGVLSDVGREDGLGTRILKSSLLGVGASAFTRRRGGLAVCLYALPEIGLGHRPCGVALKLRTWLFLASALAAKALGTGQAPFLGESLRCGGPGSAGRGGGGGATTCVVNAAGGWVAVK